MSALAAREDPAFQRRARLVGQLRASRERHSRGRGMRRNGRSPFRMEAHRLFSWRKRNTCGPAARELTLKAVQSYYTEMAAFASIVVFALVVFLASLAHYGDWARLGDAAQGVISGHPHWRAYQNRLLGPYLVWGIGHLLPSFTSALKVFTAVSLIGHNILLYALLRAVNLGWRVAIMAVGLWSAAAIMMLDRYWLYTWDLLDISVFAVAAWTLSFGRSPAILLVVFPIALLNRESALLLPIAYVLAHVARRSDRTRPGTTSRVTPLPRVFAVAGILMAVGVLFIEQSRARLFIERTEVAHFNGTTVLGNLVVLDDNIRAMMFIDVPPMTAACLALVYLSVVAMAALALRTADNSVRAVVLFFFAQVSAVLVFGHVDETRVWLPLISTVIMAFLAAGSAPRFSRP